MDRHPPLTACRMCLAGAARGRPAEILDFGYPQMSETDTLKQYISQEEIRGDKLHVSRCRAQWRASAYEAVGLTLDVAQLFDGNAVRIEEDYDPGDRGHLLAQGRH